MQLVDLPDHVYGVTELTREIKRTLETSFPPLWLKGELSDVVLHRSGHLYCTLKDAGAQMRSIMWRSNVSKLGFRPENGMEVLVYGRIAVYERGGSYQLSIEAMQPSGMGALAVEFEKLKAQLAAEGLFDPSRKKPIPKTPKRIGVVTSSSGAAVRDVLVTLGRRGFDLEVLLVPTKVQGSGAAQDVAGSLQLLQSLPELPDVILVTRGGGSLEDLWAFNEEITVRAIAACPVPVISGVGHETDTTLTDFVADLRAPTPTGAAERATPDRMEKVQHIDLLSHRLVKTMRYQLDAMQQRVERTGGGYGLRRIPDQIQQMLQRMDEYESRSERSLTYSMERLKHSVERYDDRLTALSPLKVLRRGYAVVKCGDYVIRDAADLLEGQLVNFTLPRGEATARVENVRPAKKAR